MSYCGSPCYSDVPGYIPSLHYVQRAAIAIAQHRSPGGMTDAQRIAWTNELQEDDRNGCHIDADSLRELGECHTPASIIQTLMMWAHDGGEPI